MAHVSLFLPTFTGDFSGACDALFTLDCCTVVVDPKGCCMDYLMVEDPRLSENFRRVASSRMNDVDVTMGSTASTFETARRLVRLHNPAFVALVGTTVSSIIGLDMSLISEELEDELGIPVLAVDTDGFTSYANGVHLACQAVIERFGQEGPLRPKTANILGLTPADFRTDQDGINIRYALENLGYEVLSDFCTGLTLDQVRLCPQASLNLAVSAAGLETARWMKRRWNIPYVAYTPIDSYDPLLAKLIDGTLPQPNPASCEDAGTLIVADKVIASSLRFWMQQHGANEPVAIASFFQTGQDASDGALPLSGDLELLQLLERNSYQTIIGDPLLGSIPSIGATNLVQLPPPALSASMFRASMPTFACSDPWFQQLLP